jgi:cytochrome c oxidase subunit 2
MLSNRFVTVVAAVLTVLGAAASRPEAPHRIAITAAKFAYVPSEITVKKGEPVVLVLRSTDVTHGLKVAELNIKTTEVKKGQDTELAFTPTAAGQFVGKCAHFCGKGHGTMALKINVIE